MYSHKEQRLAHVKCQRNVTYYYNEELVLVPYFLYYFI